MFRTMDSLNDKDQGGHFGLSPYRILMFFFFFFVPKYLFRCGKPKNENYFVEKLFINS